MKPTLSAALLVVFAAIASAQAPVPKAPATRTYSNPLGFSYAFPAVWEVVDHSATLAQVQQQVQQQAGDDQERRGASCIQIALSARYGMPASSVATLVLPFDCLGAEMRESDLPGMAAGAIEGLRQSMNLGEPATGSYQLGSHKAWIERLQGSIKGDMAAQYTIESVCTLVKKAAVCWTVIAADDPALGTFEQGAVTLDQDQARALVPPDAFQKKN